VRCSVVMGRENIIVLYWLLARVYAGPGACDGRAIERKMFAVCRCALIAIIHIIVVPTSITTTDLHNHYNHYTTLGL
jgi:hypothetical protein